ncbi:MAG: DUF454 domain-containing protein [Clostridia bacterium]|nr:DUF454 domain-containing protein [Clostridia bacterium]
MRGPLLTVLGLLLLGVGAVGVALPVLPTTPFVLLAAGCFGAGNPRLYGWLSRTRYFGAFLENYRTGSGVEPAVKVRALVWLWGMLILSVLLTRSLHLAIFLALVGTGVTVHILMIRTRK